MASHVRHQRHSTRNHSPLPFLRHIPTPSAKNRSEPALPAVKFLPSIQPFDFADRGSGPIQHGISDETVFITCALLSRMQALPSCRFFAFQTSGNPILWHDCPAQAGQKSATAGGRGLVPARRGNISALQASGVLHIPFAPDTPRVLRNLHDDCVQLRK